LILPFDHKRPKLGQDVFIAPTATVIGDVELGDLASVWFGSVLRGDIGAIRVGARSNIQDLSCVHLTEGLSVTIVGEDVTVGHGVILHGCRIGDRCLVGMGSTVLDNADIGADCVIAAGSLVPPRMVVPPRSLVRGSPAKVIRDVTEAELGLGPTGALHYIDIARRYREALGNKS
jgi:carbonic anhydrase/acetyltransferase-like protein (isoleucine patch superfamily)